MNDQPVDLSPAPVVRDGKPYLVIRNVTKRFGSFLALDDVSLDVYRGEFVSFLGPSGCGKTTLLRAISGLDIQNTGAIEQDGRDISRLPVGARDFGIVFQSYALFPNLNVRDNVAYGLVSEGLPREEINRRVTALLALVGLPEQARKYPIQLSGGQQQRVALARALALSPGLLLLDEPLSALDARVRARLRGEIRDLQGRLGITTIMVTHDQEEALTMSDRIVVMNAGRIEQVGTPGEIYGRPATPFVADFVGRMNFLEGRILDDTRIDVRGATLMIRGADPVRAGHAGDGLPPAGGCGRQRLRRASGQSARHADRRHGVRRQPFFHRAARRRHQSQRDSRPVDQRRAEPRVDGRQIHSRPAAA